MNHHHDNPHKKLPAHQQLVPYGENAVSELVGSGERDSEQDLEETVKAMAENAVVTALGGEVGGIDEYFANEAKEIVAVLQPGVPNGDSDIQYTLVRQLKHEYNKRLKEQANAHVYSQTSPEALPSNPTAISQEQESEPSAEELFRKGFGILLDQARKSFEQNEQNEQNEQDDMQMSRLRSYYGTEARTLANKYVSQAESAIEYRELVDESLAIMRKILEGEDTSSTQAARQTISRRGAYTGGGTTTQESPPPPQANERLGGQPEQYSTGMITLSEAVNCKVVPRGYEGGYLKPMSRTVNFPQPEGVEVNDSTVWNLTPKNLRGVMKNAVDVGWFTEVIADDGKKRPLTGDEFAQRLFETRLMIEHYVEQGRSAGRLTHEGVQKGRTWFEKEYLLAIDKKRQEYRAALKSEENEPQSDMLAIESGRQDDSSASGRRGGLFGWRRSNESTKPKEPKLVSSKKILNAYDRMVRVGDTSRNSDVGNLQNERAAFDRLLERAGFDQDAQ